MHNGLQPTVLSLQGMDSSAFGSREYFDYVIPAGADTVDARQATRLLNAVPPAAPRATPSP
ncbi:hypothetical protein LO772_00225 [Yinghuangia sp. ASG 101]|uniref:hypothetical protein n=1 Tax=Yinghuangia sp. ASG 101 TaxID=2896848 RepID=UPI001E333CAF|nr:hypothetical protein [Yinghuangia sp. ASG 101]UGQ12079.1 hypothetical protein LO772_00225 [Yinghuangia sp. ASG 101]